jgi:hypothetical protein
MMWKVFGGIALAFVAWQVINLRPVDLMTEPCKAELAGFQKSNEAIRRGVAMAQAGQAVVINGLQFTPAKAAPQLAGLQSKYDAAWADFEKRCKLF